MRKQQGLKDAKRMENSISQKKHVWKILVFLTLLAGICIRGLLSWQHFTHYDDIGLVASLCRLGESFIKRLNYRDIGWTYAPFQVGIISLLIDEKWGYIGNIILGRLPSLVFSIMNIVLITYLLVKVCHNRFAVFFSVVLITFSWENIIYASQAEPYSIGVTAMLLCMLSYFWIVEKGKINVIAAAIICAWECYASYQMFVYVFSLYISLYVYFAYRKKTRELIKAIISSVLSLIMCIPLLMKLQEYGLLGRSINWNTGTEGQFLFQLEDVENKFTYIINFFVHNTATLIRSFFVYKEQNLISDILSFAVFLAVLAGILWIHYKKHLAAPFVDICLILTCIMILMGKLTYSPSRHMLVIEPLILFLCAMGIEFFGGFRKRKAVIAAKLIYVGVLLWIFVTFVLNFQAEFRLRKNRISEKMVYEMIEEYDPVLITFYRNTFDLDLMRIKNYDKMLPGGLGPQCIKRSSAESVKRGDCVIFYSIAAAIQEEDIENIRSLIGDGKLELIEKSEYISDTDVEYAKGEFYNIPNSSYMYVYKIDEP